MPKHIGCFTSKDVKFAFLSGRIITGREKMAIQGIPLCMTEQDDMTDQEWEDIAGDMYSLPCAVVVLLAFFTSVSWDFCG